MARKTILMCVLIIFISGLLPAEDNDKKKTSIPLAQFIPGVYQLKNRKIIKGGLLLGAFLTTIAGAIIENNRGNDFYNEYLNAVVVDEIVNLRKKAEKSYRLRNYCIAGIFTVWVIHLVDVKIFKKKSGIKGEIKNNCIRIGMCIHF